MDSLNLLERLIPACQLLDLMLLLSHGSVIK